MKKNFSLCISIFLIHTVFYPNATWQCCQQYALILIQASSITPLQQETYFFVWICIHYILVTIKVLFFFCQYCYHIKQNNVCVILLFYTNTHFKFKINLLIPKGKFGCLPNKTRKSWRCVWLSLFYFTISINRGRCSFFFCLYNDEFYHFCFFYIL